MSKPRHLNEELKRMLKLAGVLNEAYFFTGDPIVVTFKDSTPRHGTVVSAYDDSRGHLIVDAEWYNDKGEVIGSHTFSGDDFGTVIHLLNDEP